jgi:hypothetical protein
MSRRVGGWTLFKTNLFKPNPLSPAPPPPHPENNRPQMSVCICFCHFMEHHLGELTLTLTGA